MKILIIEDDKFFQKFYSTKLTDAGHTVTVADNGDEGLKKIPELKPNLILLDIIMPVKDGFDVLTELSKSANKNIPVIVFSTLGQEQDVAKAKKLGARDYINKSYFDLDNLKKKIAAATR